MYYNTLANNIAWLSKNLIMNSFQITLGIKVMFGEIILNPIEVINEVKVARVQAIPNLNVK